MIIQQTLIIEITLLYKLKKGLFNNSFVACFKKFMDKSAKTFEATALLGDNIPNHKISLKISALCDMEVLKALTVISVEL